MVVNNVGSEEQTIESVPCDSKSIELKPPFSLDLSFFPWYNPAKEYSVRHFPEVLRITSFKTFSAPFLLLLSVNVPEGWKGYGFFTTCNFQTRR
jgi:hypothetical protein